MKGLVRPILVIISVSIAAFWIWALFFPPKDSVAKLQDTNWAERAEQICRDANLARNELADTRRIDDVGPGALSERADLVDRATDIVERMIDDLTAVRPTGPDDEALVTRWVGYYRTLIVDRRDYTAVLRSGENPPFPEAMIEGAPVSEYINDFTVANRMKACSTPADLAS
jgi:hypothetical protein